MNTVGKKIASATGKFLCAIFLGICTGGALHIGLEASSRSNAMRRAIDENNTGEEV